MPEIERFEVYLYIADAREGEDLARYTIEHWFTDRPGVETISALLEEAKRDFSILYPDVDAENFDVEVRRLHPREVTPRKTSAGQ